MQDQYIHCCNISGLNSNFQSAYKWGHSCEIALLKILNDLLWSMERQSVTTLILLDLSVSFDTVSHTVLLKVLEYKFGVRGVALKWFDEYVGPRKFRVCVNNMYPTDKNINFSVPQGSINGPVLFNSYSLTICEVIVTKIAVNAFAGNHSLQNDFQPRGENESKMMKLLANNVLAWMNANKLKLNPSKTEFIYFSSRQQLAKCSKTILKVGLQPVERSGLVRYLGIFFDENLSFAAHITKKCKSASWNLKRIRMIHSMLDEESCEVLVCSLVLSYLDYANGNLYGVANYLLAENSKLCARVILQIVKKFNSLQALFELHWLPVKAHVGYKLLCMIHKCLYDQYSLAYLKNLIVFNRRSGTVEGLRSNRSENLIVPYAKYKTFAWRLFSVAGPRLGNNLLVDLQNTKLYDTFKTMLNMHLFTVFVVNELD